MDQIYSQLSKVSFDDPAHRKNALDLKCNRLCAYLMALAAVQRGLTVTFLGSTSLVDRGLRDRRRRDVSGPRFLEISDGANRHLFDQTAGDLTDKLAARRADHKMTAKAALYEAKVPVPSGCLFFEDDVDSALQFIDKVKADRFTGKPALGSLAKNVFTDMDREKAREFVKTMKSDKGTILEEHIEGQEYRVYVAGGRVAGAWLRAGAYVTGDGSSTVLQLIEARNAHRAGNPLLETYLIDIPRVSDFLSKRGASISSVPASGEKVKISDSLNARAGGFYIDMFGKVPKCVAESAIKACAVLEVPNAGADIIERDGLAYILEVNTKAIIGRHSFPELGKGSGNTTAEAIVDHYFPADGPCIRDDRLVPDVAAINADFAANGKDTVHTVATVRI